MKATAVKLAKLGVFIVVAGMNRHRYLKVRAKVLEVMGRWSLYERRNLEFVRSVVKPGDRVVDVGANFGVYTELLATLVGPTGHVSAYEPIEELAKYLDLTFKGTPWVAIHPIALGEHSSDSGELSIPLLFGVMPEPALASIEKLKGTCLHQKVVIKRLDDVYPSAEPLAFVKVDVEGHEKSFFDGARETLLRCRPLVQFEENRMKDVFGAYEELFKGWGYVISFAATPAKLERYAPSCGFDGINFYLVPEERAELFGG